jgi:branched-chain amino acid aminotransferase
MIVATHDPVTGWSVPEVKPYGPIALDPASSCFHYGGNVFEGMKAYLGPDGEARLFRPDLNMRRLERSCARLALPVSIIASVHRLSLTRLHYSVQPIDGDAVLELVKRLVNIEKRWMPEESGYSLYIRPTIIATRPGSWNRLCS